MNNPPLILIVDDEASFREIFLVHLEAAGFRAEAAEGGDEGVAKAIRLKPDLILMDMEMPKVNGAMAVMMLKENPETKNIKVIFLTNYGDPMQELPEADRHFSRQIGAFEYLRKTDDPSENVEQIKKLLNNSRVYN